MVRIIVCKNAIAPGLNPSLTNDWISRQRGQVIKSLALISRV